MEKLTLNEELTKNGIFLLTSNIDNSVKDIVLELLNFKANNPTQEIKLYISAYAPRNYFNVFALFDVLTSMDNPISTYAIGAVGDLAILLLALGNKGKRYILKNTKLFLSEVINISGSGEQQTEIDIAVKETSRAREIFEEGLAKYTGKDIKTIHQDLVDAKELTSKEAIEYGLVDEVIE